jgi:hypothetical protein
MVGMVLPLKLVREASGSMENFYKLSRRLSPNSLIVLPSDLVKKDTEVKLLQRKDLVAPECCQLVSGEVQVLYNGFSLQAEGIVQLQAEVQKIGVGEV